MEDFAEIEPAGFKIQFTPHEGGGCVVSMEPSGSNPLIPNRCVRTLSIVVSNNGAVLEFPSGWNSPYLQTHATYLVTDREGMLGRLCPACKSYFRTNCFAKLLFCPYCGHQTDNGAFTTQNQSRFMFLCCKAGQEAIFKRVKTTFDLGEAVKALPNNRPAWVLTEENQQHSFTCGKCRVVFNILGEYGNCPSCGARNYSLVFGSRMRALEQRFSEADSRLSEKHQRGEEWKSILVRCVSEFEAVANDMRKQLTRIPSTPKRKADLRNLSFQNPIKANDCLRNWFAIELLNGLPEADCIFLNKMFNRRHLVVHKGGQVDEEYLKNTNDSSVRLNQIIRTDSNEIRRLITLTRKCAQNLISGFESIS
jgi:hypothetical protein